MRLILGAASMVLLVVAVSSLPASFAQSSSTVLYMDPIPPITSATYVSVSGYLGTADGYPIPNAEIIIFRGSEIVASSIDRTQTDSNGEYAIAVKVWPSEDESEEYYYASFSGYGRFEPAESVAYGMTVIGSAEEEPEDTGGCLIATAAYGSELAPQVQLLREVRDGTLLQTAAGASFMAAFNEFYYSFSPAVADLERESPVFRDMARTAITPAIYALNIMTLADSDSELSVLMLGIASICAIAGIYVAAPSLAAYCIARRVRR